MLRRSLILSCTVVIALCAAPLRGAARDPQLDLGKEYVAQINSKGIVKIRRAGAVVLRQAFIGVWIEGKFSDQLKAVKVQGSERDGLVTRRGTVPRPGISSKYEVFARATPPGPDGLRDLMLTYVVDTPLFPKAKAAVIFRLPVEAYAAKSVRLGGRAAGVFPPKQQKTAVVGMRRGVHDFLVRSDGEPVLFIGRQDPGDILVQDSRKWGTDAYEVHCLLGRTRSQPVSRRVLHVLISFGGTRGPTIARQGSNHPPATDHMLPALPTYGLFQADLDLWARFENPYRAGQIQVTGVFTQPDETTRTVPGFFDQDFERQLDQGQERLTPLGPPRWLVRFTPSQVGKHTFSIRVKTKNAQHETKAASFVAVKSDSPGFISVHRRNKRYFQFTNGKTFFPVGHNVCWGSSEKPTYDYDSYFRRMGVAGEDYTRIWMCSWGVGIEDARLDNYRLDAAWRLDYILDAARRRGIYVKLCLDNQDDYNTKGGKRKHFGIWKQNGGPCAEIADVFTHPQAKAAYRRRLDYILARWGHSPHIMAWELWNEMDYLSEVDSSAPKRPVVPRQTLVTWTQEMAAYLKRNDPHKHLVTTSLGLLTVWEELWKLKELDYAQIHAYLPKPQETMKLEERDAVLAVLNAGERAGQFGKPYHISEFGYLDLPKLNRSNEKDRHGVHLHNALWGSVFSGAAATPSIWWWKEYVDERLLYYHYASLKGFLDDLDLADKDWKRIITAGASEFRIIGIKKADRCSMWIQKKGNHWYRRVIKGEPLAELGKVKVRVPNVRPGTYRVTWWDTSRGEITNHPQKTVARPGDSERHDLILEYESGAPDIAVKAVLTKGP